MYMYVCVCACVSMCVEKERRKYRIPLLSIYKLQLTVIPPEHGEDFAIGLDLAVH